MKDIYNKKSRIWCQRFEYLMKKNGYTQKSFLKEYKSKYGGGTQANISRWLRVGENTKNSIIHFPTYETMINIADFFNVSVGYLTGETDYESFDMEKACNVIGIDEETGKAISNIVNGKAIRIGGKYYAEQLSFSLKKLINCKSFPIFINKIREHGENKYNEKHPFNYFEEAIQKIDKNILDVASQCFKNDGVVDDNVKMTDEVLEAVRLLNEARDKGYDDKFRNEEITTLSEYKLLQIYFEMINELFVDENLEGYKHEENNY